MIILAIALALAPVLALGMFVYLMDKYDREPLVWLVVAFIAGALSIYPAIEIERFFTTITIGRHYSDFGSLAIDAFLIVALTEELVKFIILRMLFYRKRFFTEPMNGIVYAVMLSLGFAAAESFRWLLVSNNVYNSALIRSFTAVPAHFVFAVFMGYFMGKARFTFSHRRAFLVFAGVFMAVLVHGTYDFFLLASWMPNGFNYLSFLFLAVSLVFSLKLILRAQKRSPFVRRRKWRKNLEQAQQQEFKDYLAGQKELLKKRVDQKRKKKKD
ncbi:MAG: PrsW family intramembrane metalloprotease [Bacteroidetes bacterium HGW-Bacteroidetes-6]|jgi:RsiW-degrading membrane proteinase PrsW (M82 family)|nr:MAG: PrsW family intramembrane metalloprotease [Bacteroidetes bacterium HGW-Bacteroidetes-6]